MHITFRGLYLFSLRSDEGSQLYIGDELVVDHDSVNTNRIASGEIALETGLHAFRLVYFEQSGEQSLTLFAKPPLIHLSRPVSPGIFRREQDISDHALQLEEGIVRGAGSQWETVSLSNTYSSMVVVCTPSYDNTFAPGRRSGSQRRWQPLRSSGRQPERLPPRRGRRALSRGGRRHVRKGDTWGEDGSPKTPFHDNGP